MTVFRTWSARANPDNATRYAEYFDRVLRPQLEAIEGFRGADVSVVAGDIRVVTRWESMAAIARFAGDPIDRAVVEPEARALLLAFDDKVVHRVED
jgi:hypothetical protein